jgi:hypothetical protein
MDPQINQKPALNEETKDAQLKSLNMLINGIKLAQGRGAFSLSESSALYEAMKSFMVDPDMEPNSLSGDEKVKTI